jgi:hypothetical protein
MNNEMAMDFAKRRPPNRVLWHEFMQMRAWIWMQWTLRRFGYRLCVTLDSQNIAIDVYIIPMR